MKILPLKSFYIITDIKEHNQNKEKLISLIYKMEEYNIANENDNISRTDWNLPKNTKREYLDFFYSMIIPYMDKMANKLKSNSWDILNAWYQIYKKQDKHGWHSHPHVNFTNVYYVNLPEEKIKTQLYDIIENKVIDEIEIKEGQLFTFPAHIIHRSPTNTSDKTKIIISFNSNFTEVLLK